MELIFLVAARRSGTTLFRLMLDGHPDVMWLRGWETVAKAIEAFEQGSALQAVAVDGLAPFQATDVVSLKRQLLDQLVALGKTSGKDFVGATCHVGFQYLARLWPDAKFVHMVRDPRDIAISNMKLGWSGHYYAAGDTWVEAETAWDELTLSLPAGQCYDLRYEDLITEPVTELKTLAAFLDIPYSDALFNYVKDGKYGYPIKGLAYRWGEKIGNDDAALVEAKARPLMIRRGYDPVSLETKYSSAQLATFRFKDRWVKRLRRIKGEGLFYTLFTKLARSVKLPFLDRMVEKMGDKKRVEHLAKLEKNY